MSLFDKPLERKVCFAAIPTPIASDVENLDAPIALNPACDLLERLSKYVDGVVVCGCTGHDSSFSVEEQVGFIRFVQENFGKKLEVIAGDGANSTKEAIELAQRVEAEAGVFVHLQISPYKVKPEQEGIMKHYEAVANSIEGRVILYDVPTRTGGVGISPGTAVRLAKHPQIIGIKEAAPGDEGIERATEIIQSTLGEDFFVLSGNDEYTLELLRRGAMGAISVGANVESDVAFVSTHFGANYEKACQVDERLKPLYDILFVETNPQPLHYMLRQQGFNVGVPRLPLTEVRPENRIQIREVMMRLNLF
ncbi:MAG: 4-hydroxy-tetrahydrodipicolinate synthase [Candidatus Pacearchaeota archaeon]|jgi:4-hydroxy-tetrahydrodipicolinate synthase